MCTFSDVALEPPYKLAAALNGQKWFGDLKLHTGFNNIKQVQYDQSIITNT